MNPNQHTRKGFLSCRGPTVLKTSTVTVREFRQIHTEKPVRPESAWETKLVEVEADLCCLLFSAGSSGLESPSLCGGSGLPAVLQR